MAYKKACDLQRGDTPKGFGGRTIVAVTTEQDETTLTFHDGAEMAFTADSQFEVEN